MLGDLGIHSYCQRERRPTHTFGRSRYNSMSCPQTNFPKKLTELQMTLRRQGLLPRRLLEGISGKLRWPWGGGRERSETGSCLILVPSVSRIIPLCSNPFCKWFWSRLNWCQKKHQVSPGIWTTRVNTQLTTGQPIPLTNVPPPR